MFDLDKLSYEAYGNLVIIVLVILALLFNLFPFYFVGFIICVMEIPIYLFVRSKFEEPIHAIGLNKCFVLTVLFYILLYFVIKFTIYLEGTELAILIATSLNVIGCYATSTFPNKQEDKGKIFFGRKKENGRYADLFRLIKFDPTNKKLCDYEKWLKDSDTYTYLVFKYIFREGKTWDETMDLLDISDRKDLDKEIYAIYRALQYACDLERID